MKEINLTGNLGLKWLQNKNYPYTDNIILNKSTSEFDHGGQYGVEIPVINNPNVVEKTIKAIKDKGIYVTRFNETIGSFLLSDQEIKEMLSICYENNYGIIISMGPRPEYDIKGSFYRSQFGLEMGRRINNNDAIKACAEEAIRLAELGCRGITVYDLGILKMLNQMRSDNLLPQEMIFKTSTHCMVTNPFLAKKWAQYTDDEMLHDEMFGADLKRMGVSKDEIYSTEPMFSTKLLQGYFYYGLEHEGRPLASLCSSYFIETLSLKTQPAWLENIEKQKGLDAVKGHKSHIQHDIEDDHSSFVWNVVASFIKSDKDKEDVINHINNVFKLFCAFYTELYRKFITKNDSSISTGITI